jgi:hypothetical protein
MTRQVKCEYKYLSCPQHSYHLYTLHIQCTQAQVKKKSSHLNSQSLTRSYPDATMFSSSILSVLALTVFSTLTSAHPLTVKRDTCTTPSTFTISNFGSFYPAAGNTNPQVVSFEFGDSSTTSPTQCSITGPSVPGVFTACSNPDVTFYYGGTDGDSGYLNVTQVIAGCERYVCVFGDLKIS